MFVCLGEGVGYARSWFHRWACFSSSQKGSSSTTSYTYTIRECVCVHGCACACIVPLSHFCVSKLPFELCVPQYILQGSMPLIVPITPMLCVPWSLPFAPCHHVLQWSVSSPAFSLGAQCPSSSLCCPLTVGPVAGQKVDMLMDLCLLSPLLALPTAVTQEPASTKLR